MSNLGPNTPHAHNVTAAQSAVGSWNLPVRANLIRVYNEGTANAFATVDGSAPTGNGDNEFFIPSGTESTDIDLTELVGSAVPVFQAICTTAALSLYVEIIQ